MGAARVTREEFERRALKAFENKEEKIDPTKLEFIGSDKKIEIFCEKLNKNNEAHGVFLKEPKELWKGRGCPKCSYENSFLSKEEFIIMAEKIYGNSFSFEKSIYSDFRTNLQITCNTCKNDFWKSPAVFLRYSVLKKDPCIHCSLNLRNVSKPKQIKRGLEAFLERAQKIHGDIYDYSYAKYITDRDKIAIKCKVIGHEMFYQTPNAHIHQRQGCPECGIDRIKTRKEDLLKKVYSYSW